ncbi:MAG: glycogen/starch/alpha-glucan phosphorylase [Oscillospiraceae bacterium]|nr:glycogen/starch/alpha-glucan phosphorylase [Oscillospiraceae bacterium]
MTAKQLAEDVKNVLLQEHSKKVEEASYDDIYKATAFCIRRMLSKKNKEFMADTYGQGKKKVYYLCIEFLMGRSLKTNLYNMGLDQVAKEMFKELGVNEERIYECESDAGLGNGGLGRLAACFMDALASDQYAGGGYSILYEYGIFKQRIVNGWQHELSDNWLPGGEVWLKAHPNQAFEVKFGGTVESVWADNFHHIIHKDYSSVMAVPHDMYISGYDSKGVSKLRLWEAKAKSIDMDSFNKGDYLQAIKAGSDAELISKVLYPNDNHVEGKILRLKQQYFFCSASINDIVTNHIAQYGTLENLADKVAIHINDTHPTLAILELMRVLLDDCGYSWEKSFEIVKNTFAYTNHTVLPEALEKWNVGLFKETLPRIYDILEELNKRARQDLFNHFPGDWGKIDYMSLVQGNEVRTANICCYVCHSINGVSELHSEIIKDTVFHDYFLFAPKKFKNVTNGIAYRRWLLQSNPALCKFLDEKIGEDYKRDAYSLKALEKYRDDAEAVKELMEIKHHNKVEFAKYLKETTGEEINPDSIFDVQVKRLHEYKRQHLNALNILAEYIEIKENPEKEFTPKTYIFGAKAAPGYYMAKQIIRLIHAIKKLVESDPVTKDKLKVVYLENYSVSLSERLMPASEISEQISLAGTEASGTGNMKFMINGAVTFGTYDGANVEIKQCCGAENFIQFGMETPEVNALKAAGYSPKKYIAKSPVLQKVMALLRSGINGDYFNEIEDSLTNNDPYMVMADFDSYHETQRYLRELYKDKFKFGQMSLMNIANAGKFSADRAIDDYAKNIWNLERIK